MSSSPSHNHTEQSKIVDFSELEKIVLQALEQTKTPGATVAIVSGDNPGDDLPIFTGAYRFGG